MNKTPHHSVPREHVPRWGKGRRAALLGGAAVAPLIAALSCGASSVSIPLEPPKLSSLTLSPRSATIQAKSGLHFLARVNRTDGSTVDVPVSWTTLGGDVNQQGDYLAPDQPGDYRVIALVSLNSSLTDTALVSVPPDSTVPPPPPPDTTSQLPPPVTGPYPNQPAGMTWNTVREFDAKVENGWIDRGDDVFSIVPDVTAPHSPPNVGQALFPTSLSPGSGPINTQHIGLNNARTLYVAFWLKLSPNFIGGGGGVNKIFHIWIGGASKAVIAAVGSGMGPLHAQVRVQNMGVPHPTVGVSWNAGTNVNQSSSQVRRGQWQLWEVVLVSNTPGVADGAIHYYLDGVKVGQYTSLVGWSSATQIGALNVWQNVSWNPTWGGSGPTLPIPQFMWMDHIYISGKD